MIFLDIQNNLQITMFFSFFNLIKMIYSIKVVTFGTFAISLCIYIYINTKLNKKKSWSFLYNIICFFDLKHFFSILFKEDEQRERKRKK